MFVIKTEILPQIMGFIPNEPQRGKNISATFHQGIKGYVQKKSAKSEPKQQKSALQSTNILSCWLCHKRRIY